MNVDTDQNNNFQNAKTSYPVRDANQRFFFPQMPPASVQ